MIYVIGCGGVGSWLVPALAKLLSPQNLMLVDGDKLEKKNLDRQLFTTNDIGRNKAQALAARYETQFIPKFYSLGLTEHSPTDWLLCACDNHPARLECLRACDMFACRTIIGANETNSAEAYLFNPEWADSPLDPRVMYPEIVSDTRFNPLAIGSGCTGEAQVENRQLSSANFMAAALMQHLLVLWHLSVPKLDASIVESLPHQLSATLSRVGCSIISDKMKGQDK